MLSFGVPDPWIFSSPAPFQGPWALRKTKIVKAAADPKHVSLGERRGVELLQWSCLEAILLPD